MKKKTRKKQVVLYPIVLLVLLLGAVFFFLHAVNQEDAINVNQKTMEEVDKQVTIFQPQPDELIEFPFTIRGEATADWFDQDQFPVRVLSEIGTVLANEVVTATAQEKDGKRPFEVVIEEFDTEDWEYGTLLFVKSDPLQFSVKEQVVLPISFK